MGIQGKEQADRGAVDYRGASWQGSVDKRVCLYDFAPDTAVRFSPAADADYDAVQESRQERKAHKLKNESQRLRNLARAGVSAAAAAGPGSTGAADDGKPPPTNSRKAHVERELATTRKSTASLGRYDSTLEGDQRRATKGVKRKFDDNLIDASEERRRELAIISSLSKHPATSRKKQQRGEDEGELNTRKAIRAVSRGRGAAALAPEARRGRGRGRGRK
jgi:regulator of ribosome biosynthesis